MAKSKKLNGYYIDSTGIVHNRKLLSNILQSNYMMINMNSNQKVSSTTPQKVLFNNILSSSGNKLNFSNNGIKIGAGVSKVRVDLALWLEAQNCYSAWHIYKNNVECTYNLFPSLASGNDAWRTGSAFSYINVQENDIIYAYVRFSVANSNNQISGSYNKACNLSVEVLE